jgi:hypothetical protein
MTTQIAWSRPLNLRWHAVIAADWTAGSLIVTAGRSRWPPPGPGHRPVIRAHAEQRRRRVRNRLDAYRYADADEVAAHIVNDPALRETLGLLASPQVR